jgi:hypothetical protein
MSEAAVRYEPLVIRLSAFAVRVGPPGTGSVLIGYLRLDDQVRWVARTLGSASQAAAIRLFRGRDAASVWVQQAADCVHRRPRRRVS